MKKNPFVIFILSICIICLLLGVATVAPQKVKPDNDANSAKLDKIIAQTNNKIAIISIDGVISSEPSNNIFEDESPSAMALNAIVRASKDESIKGVIIEINSPGGTVGMSQKIYNAVLQLRKNKPVIALMDDVAASGGYYIASAADRIVCLPGTMTGSIGVIMSTMDLHRLLNEKLSIQENVIKSGKFKDMGSSTRPMTNEERNMLQDMVNDSYEQFVDAIKVGRVERKDDYGVKIEPLNYDKLRSIADGRIFTGRQALENGLVDSTGGIDVAKEMMQLMVSKKFGLSPKVNLEYDTNYAKSSNFLKIFGVKSNANPFDAMLPQSMKYARKPLYLWE
ncbi:MAG: signal peptide peptidase SppA [Candidatus Gastranaerophilales bacterium]|nr:signal peptide peptidase SppA [Candidatus Gastranaerophilales bacterium]